MNSTDEQVERICKEIERQREVMGLSPLPKAWTPQTVSEARRAWWSLLGLVLVLAVAVLFWTAIGWLFGVLP